MLAINRLAYNNDDMNTVKFGFDRSAETKNMPLLISVPPKVQEVLDYSYAPLLRKIRQGLTSGVRSETTESGKFYRISSREIGQATMRVKAESLIRATQLILAVQQSALRFNSFDPNIRLYPTVTHQMGILPLAASVKLGHTHKSSIEKLCASAHERMAVSHNDLLNPHGTSASSLRFVSVQIYPEQGMMLGVGQPREVIKAKPAVNEAGMYELFGQPTSHEHNLILMTGAIALAETAQLLTD